MGVEKQHLINPDGNVNISIFEDVIRVDVFFQTDVGEHVLHYVDRHPENFNFENIETKFALI